MLELIPVIIIVFLFSVPRIEMPEPEPKDCAGKVIKLYYSKTPSVRCDTIKRISIISEPPFEDQLRQAACNVDANAVLFVHRVGNEVSGIAVVCQR